MQGTVTLWELNLSSAIYLLDVIKWLTKTHSRYIILSVSVFSFYMYSVYCLSLWRINVHITCQATFGCRRSRMYCVSGDGSSSYLSNGKFSITTGSHGTHEKFTTGWADLGGCIHTQHGTVNTYTQHTYIHKIVSGLCTNTAATSLTWPDLMPRRRWRSLRALAAQVEDSAPPYIPISDKFHSFIDWYPHISAILLYVVNPLFLWSASWSLSTSISM